MLVAKRRSERALRNLWTSRSARPSQNYERDGNGKGDGAAPYELSFARDPIGVDS
jgi:hypothetical protein